MRDQASCSGKKQIILKGTPMLLIRKLIIPILMLMPTSYSILAWEPSPITHQFLIGTEECRPPCWEGIIPNITTYEEALIAVEYLSTIDDQGNIDKVNFHKSIFGDGSNGIRVIIDFYENKVSNIRFDITNIDLGSVIKHFSEPDSYTFVFEVNGYVISVLYPNLGIVFISFKDFGPL